MTVRELIRELAAQADLLDEDVHVLDSDGVGGLAIMELRKVPTRYGGAPWLAIVHENID